jgi:hypothetical protein
MARWVQVSIFIVVLLVARRIIFGWLKQPDTLPQLLRQGLDIVLAYFAYVTIGMLALSFIAGEGFGKGSTIVALLLTVGTALYVGAGVFALWWFLNKSELPRRKKKR